MSTFTESDERKALRKAVASLGAKYGFEYFINAYKTGTKTTELWREAGELGYLGVALPEEYGGGGGDIGDLAAVCEELAAAGAPLLMIVVSPAIVGTVINLLGTEDQKQKWLPGIANGSTTIAFSITEPDAGSNSHNIITNAKADADGWVINGTKTYISGVDEASHILVVAKSENSKTGKVTPGLFLVPTDAPGFTKTEIAMGLQSPEKQFTLFFDNVHISADSRIGSEDGGLEAVFAGLIPERIMAAAFAIGSARRALNLATKYAKEREVWGKPIGAHQAIAHELAKSHIEIEMASLLTQKASALLAAGDFMGAGEASNMAKYAAAEAIANSVDRAIHTHGGNGLAEEYGVIQMLVGSRLARIAPVSKEMVLNFVAQFSLGLPKSY